MGMPSRLRLAGLATVVFCATPAIAAEPPALAQDAPVPGPPAAPVTAPPPLRRAPDATEAAAATRDTLPPTPIDFAAAGIACPVCGNIAAARSRFCHHCGHIIGEAERRRVARHE
mgnify:CR=1 FL=1